MKPGNSQKPGAKTPAAEATLQQVEELIVAKQAEVTEREDAHSRAKAALTRASEVKKQAQQDLSELIAQMAAIMTGTPYQSRFDLQPDDAETATEPVGS